MGLDMYLERMPRYKNATPDDVMGVENYLDWQRRMEEGSEYANCSSFEEWCGRKEIPSFDMIDFYTPFYKAYYSDWDTEHQHPWMRIHEEVGYWRKANHIHNWFVENIQDGEDDCRYHREIGKADLLDLLDICEVVLASCNLIEGEVCNGHSYRNGVETPIMEHGKYVEDPKTAKELLPTTSGFFFGGTDYDEWYVESIKNTIRIIRNVLATTNFDTHMICYISSW